MIRNRCVSCDFVIEAPADHAGREVVCPSCEATNILRTEEDLAQLQLEESLRDEAARDAFFDQLNSAPRRTIEPAARQPAPPGRAVGRGAGVDYSPSVVSTSPDGVVTKNMAAMATRRLKDISIYLLAFAYVFPLLALAPAVAIGVFGDLPGVWGVFAFLTGAFVGVFSFVFFKWMSDAARALADFGDLARGIDARLTQIQATQTVSQQPDTRVRSGSRRFDRPLETSS